MPLIPRDGGPTVDIEVDGDIYTLKTMLSFYEREQISSRAMKMQIPYGRVKETDIKEDDVVDVVLDTAELKHKKISLWLRRWSHDEPCNSNSIRRLPLHHAEAILKKIQELEKVLDGVKENSPLEKSSNGLSEQSSSKIEVEST